MNGMSRENWAFGAQIVSAIGILVIAVVTFINQSNTEFRDEIRAELTGLRTEMQSEFASIRSEIHDMNTRLGRVEGILRVSGNE
ncbi:MAG: hypothetical protein F4X08_12090 [Gemmatimonadetes bacterium]|nr:hypothetical protein [Gemmatimonadota bacterium]